MASCIDSPTSTLGNTGSHPKECSWQKDATLKETHLSFSLGLVTPTILPPSRAATAAAAAAASLALALALALLRLTLLSGASILSNAAFALSLQSLFTMANTAVSRLDPFRFSSKQ